MAGTFSVAAPVASTTYTSPHGYQIVLPDTWRRSDALSATFTKGSKLAQEIFTFRSQADENDASTKPGEDARWSRSWHYTVVVVVYSNPKNESAAVWTADMLNTGWAREQSVSTLTFDGRAAVRIVAGAKYSSVTYVPAVGQMFEVGIKTNLPGETPMATDRATLDNIADSFHLTKP